MSYSVGQVASFAGVTVRTLRHYDAIGLLCPRGRSAAGYRRYGECDLERLQQILYYRELGFALEEIATILDDPSTDATAHLRRQRTLLTQRMGRLRAMVAAVEHAMAARITGTSLTPEELFEVFGDWPPREGYAEEAERRWGDIEAWQQSRKRMSEYSKEDLLRMHAETREWVQRLRAVMQAGASPRSEEAMDLAEEHRRHLHRWWFDCDHDFHLQLTELLVTEPEQLDFLVRPEQQLPGMGAFIRDAATANAERAC
ncbi:MAG: MerR family transcriptional regulator [Actinomycetota bacterium]|nr:MerR family transcriptional regulator [Actinomycetota bacterium]